ncbi:MAG: hypothetical protein LBQ90_00070, partial [Synergistaceae bacterium]|nr:hypothetical protein [Synergistaceae bacterium]
MKRISGKLLISVLLGIFMFAGGAWAEPYVATVYDAWTFLRGGKAAYDAAGFGNLNIYVGDTRGKIETDDSTSGTFTITGAGSYTVRSVNGIIEDAPNPFPLIAQEYGDNWVTFHPAVDGNSVWFTREAETGLPGSLITWSHPSYGDDVRTFEVPTHRPVQQQLAEFVPYVEYVLDPEGRISEILWRFVTSDATDTPVPAPFDGQLWSIWVTTKYPSKIDLEFSSFSDYNFSEGTQLFGSSVLPFPIAPADIEAVHVMFKAPAEDGSETFYNWDFVALTPRVEAMYRSDGALFDGRSVYDEAKFSHIRLAIVENHTDNTLIGETGSLTVRGGRYTVTTDAGIGSTGTDIDSVSDTEKTFDLSLESTSNDNYVGHWPSVDGECILFTGEAETGLNGQEVVWKHPAYGEDVEYSCTL